MANVTRLPTKPQALVVKASDVEPRPLDPVWDGVLWAGKPTLVAGDPGEGKSMLTCNIAAQVTTGEPWPCSTERRQPANVMMLSAEDDPEDTIVPRLIAAGADLQRVSFVRGVIDKSDGVARKCWLSLDRHIEQLDAALTARPARLIIIDPLSAYMGSGTDSNNEGDVRPVLAGLAELAQKHQASVLAIRHMRKSESTSPHQRIIGSVAFTAAARAVYGVVRDPDDEDRRLFLCVKNNLAADAAGYRYIIKVNDDGIPYAAWDDERETRTAAEILGAAPDRKHAVDAAELWLQDVLAHGAIRSSEMRELAAEAGQSWRTVERARTKMGGIAIERISRGNAGAGAWQWRLVTPPAATPPLPLSDIGGLAGDAAASTFQPPGRCKTATPPKHARAREARCARCDDEGCAWCTEAST